MITVLKSMRLNKEVSKTLPSELENALERCCKYQISNGQIVGFGDTLEHAIKAMVNKFIKNDQLLSNLAWNGISCKEKDIPDDVIVATIYTLNDLCEYAGVFPDDFINEKLIVRTIDVNLSGHVYNKETTEQLELSMGE